MLDTNKLDEIGMNTDTINMMKDMNMSNDDILNELKTILTLYSEDLIKCLINDINEPLFQSILLRIKLQNKLKLDNSKLIKTFTKNLQPLIKYLLNNNIEENEVFIEEEKKEETNNKEDTDNDIDDDNINSYMEECIKEDKGNKLNVEDVYDDYEQWLEEKKLLDSKVDKEVFVKILSKKFGKVVKKCWKDINLNIDD